LMVNSQKALSVSGMASGVRDGRVLMVESHRAAIMRKLH
jgi:hypothetical protein